MSRIEELKDYREKLNAIKKRDEDRMIEQDMTKAIDVASRYRDRAVELIETAKACLKAGISLGTKKDLGFFKSDYFMTDGITHKIGFCFDCSGSVVIGIENGGQNGPWNLMYDGESISYVSEYGCVALPYNVKSFRYDINKFESTFDEFERSFYEYVDKKLKEVENVIILY